MMVFMWNVLLALVWTAATAQFTFGNLFVGYLLGYLTLWFLQPVTGPSRYFRKVAQSLGFSLFFLRELVRANLRVAYDVITPTYHMRPGIVAVPLDAETDFEIMLLANLITLTPGSLSLHLSDDRRVLFVHAMFIENPDQLRRDIKEGFERRLLELLR